VPLTTETFPGSPGGSNVAMAQSELDDTEARIIQDAWLDYPGRIRRRGPLSAVSGIAALSNPATSLVMALNPQGSMRLGALNGDGTNGYLSAYSDDLTTKVDLAWPYRLPTNSPTNASRIVDSKAALNGGLMLGVSSAYDSNSPEQGIAFWRGGNKANYTTGTLGLTRGSATVTGSGTAWGANVVSGMFLFANTDDPYTSAYIGVVLTVNSDTSITLAQVSPYTATAKAYTLQSLRGLAPQVVTGRITCDTTSTTVNGGNTKFVDQGMGTGSWNIYRQSDFGWIGKVSAVATNTSLTLAANAALSLSDAEYTAIRADADFSIINTANVNKVGFLNAVYAQRQWYANLGAQFDKTTRVWFSDTDNPEALDLSPGDGDFIPVTSTGPINEPIEAIMPAYNALVVLKENETFALYGSSRSQFAVKKLEDDGTLSGMSAQSYGGGVLWAGRQGIHYYDGVEVSNLTEAKLGDVWKNSIRTFDPTKYRIWSMLVRNHYVLWVENLAPTLAIVKGNTSSTPTSWGVAINMVTRAVTFLTNVHLRGAVVLPASSSRSVWLVVNDATKGVICDAETLFDQESIDTVACEGGTLGPDFFYESKKFDAGDGLRLKRFKMLLLHYLVQSGDIKVDTVIGLNNIGQTLTSVFPGSTVTWDTLRTTLTTWDAVRAQFSIWNDILSALFVPKRVKFQRGSQYLSFRLYQSSSSITRLQLGPFQIAYKLKRPGRV